MVIFLCELNTNTNTHAVAGNRAAHMHHKSVFLMFVIMSFVEEARTS